MSLFDGEEAPLTLGQALVEVAKAAGGGYGHESHLAEIVDTFRTAFPDDVTPTGPAPSTGVTDPQVQAMNAQAQQLAKQAQELAEARARNAELALELERARNAALAAQLAAYNAGATPAQVELPPVGDGSMGDSHAATPHDAPEQAAADAAAANPLAAGASRVRAASDTGA